MIHKLIHLHCVGLSFPHKTCFNALDTYVSYGQKIAIIGRNGSGKSTLLNIIRGHCEPTHGTIHRPDGIIFGYVPQVIHEQDDLSGGQRFHHALTQALNMNPHVLLLDEPTNHLDHKNRPALMRMLRGFPGTLIVVSHDVTLLNTCVDHLWHLDEGRIHIFSGHYNDYQQQRARQRTSLEREITHLDRQKKDTHQALMKEQVRAAKSKEKGQKSIDQRKWPTIVSKAKSGRSEETSGRKQTEIARQKQHVTDQLAQRRLPEIIVPTFSLNASDLGQRAVLSIHGGCIRYHDQDLLLDSLCLSLMPGERMALHGLNGSGKSTFLKALLDDPRIIRSGTWHTPPIHHIGYLDQHYRTLNHDLSALSAIQSLRADWNHADIRRHLNGFLFRKNEEVNTPVALLSGGERARLSLAQIAANTPRLLILDEITNNLDLETREYVIQVLRAYPGSMIVVSHDEAFLEECRLNQSWTIKGTKLEQAPCNTPLS